MPVIIEHIGGAIITVSDGSTLRSIYLPESELRGLYESLMVFYGDFKKELLAYCNLYGVQPVVA